MGRQFLSILLASVMCLHLSMMQGKIFLNTVVYSVEPVHEPKLDICHLCGLGASYLETFFYVDPNVQMIPN